jgi:hypothetical protein
VRYRSKVYQARIANRHVAPTRTKYWQPITLAPVSGPTGATDPTGTTGVTGTTGASGATGATGPGWADPTAAPPASGIGRRIIWSKSANRVWVVDEAETLVRSYPVTDNDDLTPLGQYPVLRMNPMSSTGTNPATKLQLPYFIAFFRRCRTCEYIGFHQIPVDVSGQPIEPETGLGTDLFKSHGCVRESAVDAAFLFGFATIGTQVVVVP